jgi:hypothetical protein
LPAGAVTCCNRREKPPTQEKAMRTAFMSMQKGNLTYPEDMTLSDRTELGDFGACRRR